MAKKYLSVGDHVVLALTTGKVTGTVRKISECGLVSAVFCSDGRMHTVRTDLRPAHVYDPSVTSVRFARLTAPPVAL